jgi:hypothetical protein
MDCGEKVSGGLIVSGGNGSVLFELAVALAKLGADPAPMTPAQFATFIADDTEKWAKVVKFAHIKLD